jgi:hypothetical protein
MYAVSRYIQAIMNSSSYCISEGDNVVINSRVLTSLTLMRHGCIVRRWVWFVVAVLEPVNSSCYITHQISRQPRVFYANCQTPLETNRNRYRLLFSVRNTSTCSPLLKGGFAVVWFVLRVKVYIPTCLTVLYSCFVALKESRSFIVSFIAFSDKYLSIYTSYFIDSLFLFPVAPTLEHRTSVKRFVSLQFFNHNTVGFLVRGISLSQGRYLHTGQHKQNKRTQIYMP